METIHLKTIDPISQELIRAAARKGIPLNWERYEKLQPQDGFLRVGLSCPYGCLQGPCRIDPFGRGPDRGVCGLDRDGMVAALLLRITLQGALESAEEAEAEGSTFDRDLRGNLLESPVSIHELFRSAGMLKRPAGSPGQLIRQALRLGVLTTRLLETKGGKRTAACEAGYGLLAQRQPVIAVCGNPPPAFLQSLVQSAGREVRIVTLGEWVYCVDRFLPCVCSSGEAELVLSSGRIDLIVSGSVVDPGIVTICEAMKIPVLPCADGINPEDILNRANRHYTQNGQMSFQPESSLKESATVFLTAGALKDDIGKIDGAKIALIGGSDSPQGTMGHLAVEVAGALAGAGLRVGAWGDAAIWMIKGGLCSEERSLPVRVLDPHTGPLQAVKALSGKKMASRLAGILYTPKDCRDVAVALGLAASGVPVCLSTPIPVWGSETVRKIIDGQTRVSGGSLVHFDHPVQPAELLDWFGVK